MTTWTLVIIFSWVVGGSGSVAHSGMSVSGFETKEACKLAQELMAYDTGSKSACLPSKLL